MMMFCSLVLSFHVSKKQKSPDFQHTQANTNVAGRDIVGCCAIFTKQIKHDSGFQTMWGSVTSLLLPALYQLI